MFTGIIESIGQIKRIEHRQNDARVTVLVNKLGMSDVALGDSIAVNGVCLTVVHFDANHFEADVSGETLAKTAFRTLKSGSQVNLEKALTPTTRLGGHLVSGHVDGVGQVVSTYPAGESVVFVVKAPDELARYIAKKGSITIDGVSLTVNEVKGAEFYINIVPHTIGETIIKDYKVDTEINLEVDLLARYLERLMLGDKAAQSGGLTESFLQENGFA